MAACPAATVVSYDAAQCLPVLFLCGAPEIHPVRIFKRSLDGPRRFALATSMPRSMPNVGGQGGEQCGKTGCFIFLTENRAENLKVAEREMRMGGGGGLM